MQKFIQTAQQIILAAKTAQQIFSQQQFQLFGGLTGKEKQALMQYYQFLMLLHTTWLYATGRSGCITQ